MWPFSRRTTDADAARIAELQRDLDGLGEDYANLVAQLGDAEAKASAMQTAMTDEGIAELARGVTAAIADIYAAGRGSVLQRDIAVHAAVAAAIRVAAHGERHWNEGGLAATAQSERQS